MSLDGNILLLQLFRLFVNGLWSLGLCLEFDIVEILSWWWLKWFGTAQIQDSWNLVFESIKEVIFIGDLYLESTK